MTMKFKLKPVAVMVSALLVSPLAMAGDLIDESYSVSVDNATDVSLKKHIKVKKDVDITGNIHFYGSNPVNASSMAVVDDKQFNTSNSVENMHHHNNANLRDNALENAKGNIGANVSAGDNNMQDNAAAIAVTDANFVFGSSDAEVFVTQAVAGNATTNTGNENYASISGNALKNASGNIGANVTSGNSNVQKNNMAISVSTSRMSEASVANVQRSAGNSTTNEGRFDVYEDTTNVTMYGSMEGGYYGWTNGSYKGTESGTTHGTSDQIGDLYLDTWAPDSNGGYQHPTDGPATGHVDVDSAAQGAQDLNDDGGALAFTNDGTYEGKSSGSYKGWEAGYQDLSGTFSGTVTTTRVVYTPTSNNASLSGNALANASGNIGVNVSSGTGNMQNNSLAIATSFAPAGGPQPIPGE